MTTKDDFTKIYKSLLYRLDAYKKRRLLQYTLFYHYIDDRGEACIPLKDIETISELIQAYKDSGMEMVVEWIDDELSGIDDESFRIVREAVQGMEYDSQRADNLGVLIDDLLGSASAQEAGEFYTPQAIGKLLVRLVENDMQDGYDRSDTPTNPAIYDPACGSGGLLMAYLHHTKKRSRVYGQELNRESATLARMNSCLHGCDGYIAQGDTLEDPKTLSEKMDIIVMNPPYGCTWSGKKSKAMQEDERWGGLLAPSSRSDLAFVQHALYHLKEGGKLGVVMFPGALYRQGAEKKIRQWIVDNGYLDAVISLPSKLFTNTDISTCILLMTKRADPSECQGIEFVEAGTWCEWDAGIKRNVMTDDHLDKVVQSVIAGADSRDTGYATIKDIREQDYSLSVGLYTRE